MLIRPRDWWPTPHTQDELSKSEETDAITWAVAFVNSKGRCVTSDELKKAFTADMTTIIGREASLSARQLEDLAVRCDTELRVGETPQALVLEEL